MLLYLTFHRQHAVVPAFVHATRAEDNQNNTEHNALFYTTISLVVIFIVYLTYKIIQNLINKRTATETENTVYTLELIEKLENNEIKCKLSKPTPVTTIVADEVKA
ncbi:unnamed protein product [Ceutorhynchus assimilis]|uniref:Uncharacterized protein n=1 Tax=Ceutorhynchus assimilis TaxID=467358 RepID=A0A9N9Q892_9CUCU|nr:unnamed protein product [Ceutorhynchus assimilis]